MANETMKTNEQQWVLSVLVQNRFGVLSHVAGLFATRGYNIDSLAVGETHDPTISRMTIVTRGDERVIDLIVKQLNRLCDVIEVKNLNYEAGFVERELCLIKVQCEPKNRVELFNILLAFEAKVQDFRVSTVTVELSASASKINALIEILRPFGIVELARTGRVALKRG
ncbi:MAG: acetolactate synthase small subunit [Candidatus Sumerlaeia bacterium]